MGLVHHLLFFHFAHLIKKNLTRYAFVNLILRACLEVLAGERSYSYTLDRRPVFLYRGWSSSSTERAASGGTHMER